MEYSCPPEFKANLSNNSILISFLLLCTIGIVERRASIKIKHCLSFEVNTYVLEFSLFSVAIIFLLAVRNITNHRIKKELQM